MLKKIISVLLIGLVMNLAVVGAFAETKEEKEAKSAEKVKTQVAKLGTGKDARIQVKLKDGTKLKGYVREIKENSFLVMNENTGEPTEVPYPKIKQVKGNNLATGVKIAIGVGIVVALLVIISFIGRDS